MTVHDVAIIGTGGISRAHAKAYQSLENCELIACADIDEDSAATFSDEFGIPDSGLYSDYRAMLQARKFDVVSVCTPPSVHADPVIDCARADVGAVHCEKPMADTWGDARLMAQECHRRGVQLTVNHENRFADPVVRSKKLVDDGAIGAVERIEIGGKDLYESGTHLVDICNWFAGDRPAEWVLGGIDYSELDVRNGVHNENSAVALWGYDGIHGAAYTGVDSDFLFRVEGTDGELMLPGRNTAGLRLRRDGDGWEFVETDSDFRGNFKPAIAHVVKAFESDDEPLLSARHALNATEIIFAVWESVRRRGRVILPLSISDNPLEAMVNDGDVSPE